MLEKIKATAKKVQKFVEEHEVEIFEIGVIVVSTAIVAGLAALEAKSAEDNALHMITLVDDENKYIGTYIVTGRELKELEAKEGAA